MLTLINHSNLDSQTIAAQTQSAELAWEKVLSKNDMIGWVDPSFNPATLDHIKHCAAKIQNDSTYLVCIGIGGSYLGHKAIYEALKKPNTRTKLLFAGNSLDPYDLEETLQILGDNDFSINVISKSGTTLEPALAFDIFKQKLIEKYGEKEAYKRIYATTDREKGALKTEATKNQYETFEIPDNIGGRFSVLTSVGLLPLAVAGIDIESILTGAKAQATLETQTSPKTQADPAFTYAALRHILRTKNYTTEILSSFTTRTKYLAEWWKQLFGESEGKMNGGIFPASTIFSTDLHSLGQYLQQGRRNIFETFLTIKSANETINKKAEIATITAHTKHHPVFEINLDTLDEKNLGAFLYFFEKSCAISATLQGVNPFDQPGVEDYKTELKRLLAK